MGDQFFTITETLQLDKILVIDLADHSKGLALRSTGRLECPLSMLSTALGFPHVPALFASPTSVSSYCIGFHSSERVYGGAYDELFAASLNCATFTDYTCDSSILYSIFTGIAAVDTWNAVYVNRVTSLHAELVRDE